MLFTFFVCILYYNYHELTWFLLCHLILEFVLFLLTISRFVEFFRVKSLPSEPAISRRTSNSRLYLSAASIVGLHVILLNLSCDLRFLLIGLFHNTVLTKILLTQVAKIFFILSAPYSNPFWIFSKPKNEKRAFLTNAMSWRFLAPGTLYTISPYCSYRG